MDTSQKKYKLQKKKKSLWSHRNMWNLCFCENTNQNCNEVACHVIKIAIIKKMEEMLEDVKKENSYTLLERM